MPDVYVNSEELTPSDPKQLEHLLSVRDEDIDYSDIPELDEEFFRNAKLIFPPKKQLISLRLDQDVVDWFKAHGKGYQTLLNAVLRTYMAGVKDQKSQETPSENA